MTRLERLAMASCAAVLYTIAIGTAIAAFVIEADGIVKNITFGTAVLVFGSASAILAGVIEPE